MKDLNKDKNGNSYEFWYCDHCVQEVCPENVTFSELHDVCGHPVRWVSLDRDER